MDTHPTPLDAAAIDTGTAPVPELTTAGKIVNGPGRRSRSTSLDRLRRTARGRPLVANLSPRNPNFLPGPDD